MSVITAHDKTVIRESSKGYGNAIRFDHNGIVVVIDPVLKQVVTVAWRREYDVNGGVEHRTG